jgi:hypothetical protein
VRIWLEIDVWLATLHLEVGFTLSLCLSLALEVALGPSVLGARGVATIAVSAFGRTLSLSVGFSVDAGQLDYARARVERFLALGLTAAVPDPATGLNPPAAPPAQPSTEKKVDAAAAQSGVLAETDRPPPEPISGSDVVVKIQLGDKAPAAPRFFAMLFELKAAPRIYVVQLVPRDMTETGGTLDVDDKMTIDDETFYAPPEDEYTYRIHNASSVDWRLFGADATTRVTDGDLPKPGLQAIVAKSQNSGSSQQLTLRELLQGAYPRQTVRYNTATKKSSPDDPLPPMQHLENDSIDPTEIAPATPELAKAALADAAGAAAKLSIRRSLLRAVEERRSSIIAAIAASAERIANEAYLKGDGTSLDDIIWPARPEPNESGVIDARDFGLTFVAREPIDGRLDDTLSGLFQPNSDGPLSSKFTLQLRKDQQDVGDARHVLLFNPPSIFFDRANPILAGLTYEQDRRGIALDWDLKAGWSDGAGAWSDPEFHLKCYRIARVFLHNGELLSGLKPFETTTKAAAPLHPMVTGDKIVWRPVRPLTQFVDDFADLPDDLRPALLGRAVDSGDENAVETSRAAWKDRLTIEPDEPIQIEYTIVPVDIAGREAAGSALRVEIPGYKAPNKGLARAELIVAFGFLPRSRLDEAVAPVALALRIDDLDARVDDLDARVDDLGKPIDDKDQPERLADPSTQYELRVRPEPPAPIGLLGADAVTAALGRPTPDAFDVEHQDDKTFYLTLHYSAPVGGIPAYKRENAFSAVSIVDRAPAGDAPYFTVSGEKPATLADLIAALGCVGDGSGATPRPVRVAVRGHASKFEDTDPRGRWLIAETYLRVGSPKPDRLGRMQPRPIDTIVETFEAPVAAGFAPLRFEDLYGEAGRLLIDYPHPNSDFTAFTKALDENGAKEQRLRLRDGDRRVATRVRWNSRPTQPSPVAAPGVVNASPDFIAGFDVFEIDLTGALTRQDVVDTARDVARVMTLDPRLANAEPSTIEDYGAIEAFYQSEALRLSQAKGAARRAAWYSPAESLGTWPDFSIRRSLGLAINDADFSPLFTQGQPNQIEVAFDGAPPLDAQGRLDRKQASGAWARLDELGVDAQGNKRGAISFEIINANFVASPSTTVDGIVFESKAKDSNHQPEAFDAAKLRRLLFDLVISADSNAWWNDRSFRSNVFANRALLNGLDIKLTARRTLDVGAPRVLGEATFRVDLDQFLHPVLADALDAMRWETKDGFYRRYQPVIDPAPHTDAKNFAEFLDQRPIGRDPYGWAVLRTLGLAIGVRLFDMVSGDFVEPKDALPRIQDAFALALARYKNLSLGAPTVDVLARAEGLYRLASFDGGSPATAASDSFACELASLTQLSLRPIAEDLEPAGAFAACLYYRVQASPDAMTISVNMKDAAGDRIVDEPLLIDLIDVSSGLSAGLVTPIAANDDQDAIERLVAGRRTQETFTRKLEKDLGPRKVLLLRIMTTRKAQDFDELLKRIVTTDAGLLTLEQLPTPSARAAGGAEPDAPEPFERFPELPASAIAALVAGVFAREATGGAPALVKPQIAASDNFARLRFYAEARFPGQPLVFDSNDKAEAFFARWPGLIRRFLANGPASPPRTASIAYAFALIPRPQPFRAPIDSDGTMQILLIHRDRFARRRRYMVLVTWRPDAHEAKLELSAGKDDTQGPQTALSWDATAESFSADLTGSPLHQDVISVYVAPSAADTYLALERGALWLPRPAAQGPEKTSDRTAFDGLVYARLRDLGGGSRPALTIEAAVAAEVEASFDLSANTAAEPTLRFYGVHGALDGALWAFRGAPSEDEFIPTLEGGPIALKSAPLLIGQRPPGESWAGQMSPIKNSAAPAKVTLTVPAPAGGWAAMHWAPIRDPALAAMPLVAAMNMTRAAANATEPSRSRDLIPRRRAASGETVGSPLPSAAITAVNAEDKTGWSEIEPTQQRDVPMAALTLPGVEFTAGARPKASLRYDLPILDELFASAAPRRAPATADAVSTTPDAAVAGPKSLAGALPAPLLDAWREALRRRDLARTRDDVFWAAPGAGQVAAPLAYPFVWAALDVAIDVAASSGLPLGSYKIKEREIDPGERPLADQEGEAALAGYSANFQATSAPPPRMTITDDGLLKVTGFALAPYDVAIGGDGLPVADKAGDALADTAGHAIAKAPDKPAPPTANWTTRAMQARLDADSRPVPRRLLTTTREPIRVTLGGEALIDLRDVPLDVNGNLWTFAAAAPETAPGPDPSVFGRGKLASSLYEWRHYRAPADNKPPGYEIAVGVLRLRPLRLWGIEADGTGGICQSAVVVYSAGLGFNTEAASYEDAPFAADLAYATGNLVAIAFVADGGGGLKAAQIGAVERDKDGKLDAPDFSKAPRLALRTTKAKVVHRGDGAWPAPGAGAGESRLVEFGFELELAGDGIRPRANTGFLSATAFGSAFEETNLAIAIAADRLRLEPPTRDIAGFGLAIRGLGLDVGDAAADLLIDAELRLDDGGARAETPAPIRLPVGGDLSWYGATLPLERENVVVDHDQGFVQVGITAARGALLRGLPEFDQIEGYLAAAFAAATDLSKPVPIAHARLEIAAGFASPDKAGRLDFQLDSARKTLLNLQPSARLRRSVIAWPIDAVRDAGGATALSSTLWKTEFAGLDAEADLEIGSSTAPVVHEVTAHFEPIDISAKTIAFDAGPGAKVWRLGDGVRTQALCEHRLTQAPAGEPAKTHAWTSVDDIALVDLVALRTATLYEYAFSPRYRAAAKNGDDMQTPQSEVPGAGIVRAPLFGRVLRETLAGTDPSLIWPGLAMFGGAVVEWPLTAETALTVPLPWLAALHDDPSVLPTLKPLQAIPQAPAAGALTVCVTAFDLAGAIPLLFAEVGRTPVAAGPQGLRDALETAVSAARQRAQPRSDRFKLKDRRCADLAFVSNSTPGVADPFSVPLFWRALLAVMRLFKDAPDAVAAATVIGDTDLGLAHRVTVRAPNAAQSKSDDALAALIAIGGAESRSTPLPSAPDLGDPDSLRRLGALAENVVKAPFAVYVARPRNARCFDDPCAFHDGFNKVPLSFGQSAPSPRPLRDWTSAVHASSALGWPRQGGLKKAKSRTLALGVETPLQDKKFAWAGRARRLSGELLAPAAPKDRETVFTAADFLAVGRRIAFARDVGADPPVFTAPADRSLTPVPARTRAPTPAALADAFLSAGLAPEAPCAGFLPGHYELVVTGVRPGVMAFEHEGIVSAGAESPFDAEDDRFGRPADRMPLVWRQGRAPRSTGLPWTRDLSLSRRSFVAENLPMDGKLQPVALIAGAGEAIRYTHLEIAQAGEPSDALMQAILVRCAAKPGIDDDVDVLFGRPSTDDKPKLADALARLGVLRAGASGLGAMLTIGAARISFSQARFKATATPVAGFDVVTLTLTKASARQDVVAAVTASDADTRAILTLTAANVEASAVAPAAEFDLATAPANGFVPGPPRVLSLHLPLTPLNEAFLPLSVVTAIFGDAAYDRELASLANSAPSKPGVMPPLLLAADRTDYDLGETVHFALGAPNPAFKTPAGGENGEPPLLTKAGQLRIAVAPQPVGGVAQEQRELRIAGVALDPTGPFYTVASPGPYAIAIPALRETSGEMARLAPGDRLVLIVDPRDSEPLVLNCNLVADPVIAPPAAIYGLVTLDRLAGEGEETALVATPALFASAPLPSRVEFPDLLRDLVRGHVRRKALYLWSFSARAAPARGAPYGGLVKIDRTGGGQIPTDKDNFQPIQDFSATEGGR